jgi:hypothetical protein
LTKIPIFDIMTIEALERLSTQPLQELRQKEIRFQR